MARRAKMTPIRTKSTMRTCLTDSHASGCGKCRLYKCVGCNRWVPWSNGAADDMPNHCDDCWSKAHKVAA